MKVLCDVEEVELENEDGFPMDGVKVTCRRCDEEEESYGTSDRSVRRCLVLLRENCPMGESNFYTTEKD